MKVFYYLKPGYRGRQTDNVIYLPKSIEPVLYYKINKENKDEEGTILKQKNIYSYFFPLNPFFINIKDAKKIGDVEADLIYTYGAFLKNTKIPYVINVDNPACFTYYSAIALYNPFVRRLINKHFPISLAAKKGLENAYGNEIAEKIEVIYPPLSNMKFSEDSDYPRFIFISYNFYIKGGREILNALKKVHGEYKFTIVSDIPDEFLPLAKKMGVNVYKKIPRKILLNDIIPYHDVVVHPSYMDSFGVAPFECINAGLAGIGTDMYAIPEFIEHGNNGFIIESPIKYFNEKFLPNLKYWLFPSVEPYVKPNRFEKVEHKLAEYIQYYIDNPSELKKHKKYSRKLHEEKFSLTIYQKKVEHIFKKIL